MGTTRKGKSPGNTVLIWLLMKPAKVKIFLAVAFVVCSLVAIKLFVDDRHYDYFFIVSEAVHAAGILVLIYKLGTKKTCSGLSLKTQELTALFLAARLVSNPLIEFNIHTVLDVATLVFTLWVIYMIRFKLKSTYTKELDNLPVYYIAVPCAILAFVVHPFRHSFRGIMWAFCVYVESVSVLPQLRLMQNAKMIEPFTSHYVFALGIARFLSFANWTIQIIETGGRYFFLFGYGYLWFPFAFLAEMIQTFILADFCYYYLKSLRDGQLVMRMPV